MNTDLTFFTNEKDSTLLNRLIKGSGLPKKRQFSIIWIDMKMSAAERKCLLDSEH